MSKTNNEFPREMNTTILMQRIKKDLIWILVSLAVSLAAAVGTYMLLTK
jgi:hypothetical protein